MKLRRWLTEEVGGPTLFFGVELNVPPKIVKILINEPTGPFSKYTVQYRVKDGVTCFVGLTKFSAVLYHIGLKGIAVQLSRRFVQRRRNY